jgi:hypothetical protein
MTILQMEHVCVGTLNHDLWLIRPRLLPAELVELEETEQNAHPKLTQSISFHTPPS